MAAAAGEEGRGASKASAANWRQAEEEAAAEKSAEKASRHGGFEAEKARKRSGVIGGAEKNNEKREK